MIKRESGVSLAFGCKPPKFYGLAYREPCRDEMVFAVIPLNLIIRLFRSLWHHLRYPTPDGFDRKVREAYKAGYEAGLKANLVPQKIKISQILSEVDRAIDELRSQKV